MVLFKNLKHTFPIISLHLILETTFLGYLNCFPTNRCSEKERERICPLQKHKLKGNEPPNSYTFREENSGMIKKDFLHDGYLIA